MKDNYIDARGKSELEYYDCCATCKEEFVVRLHLRHKCEDCRKKELDSILNRPLFDFHWKKLWEHFDGLFKAFRF